MVSQNHNNNDTTSQKEKETTSSVVLKNITCPYCGTKLTNETRSKEHVIGRNFVPKGALNDHMNIILYACSPCNTLKSDLEDDISAISLYNSLQHGCLDIELQRLAAHKAQVSRSRKTKKFISNSHEQLNLSGTLFDNAQFSWQVSAPPQVSSQRAFELGTLHLQALFYVQSYNVANRTGNHLPGPVLPFNIAATPDWGNVYQQKFSEEIQDWEHRLSLGTASGYFQARIRKIANQPCWGWALEWNRWFRLTGFFGEEISIQMVAKRLAEAIPEDQHPIIGGYKVRFEVPLEPSKDTLFS